MTTTKESPVRQCPACGAKITRPELSLCAYCGAPVGLLSKDEARQAGEESVTMRRLAKMADHKLYASAMAWDPPDSERVQAGRRSVRRGRLLFVVGLALAAALVAGTDAWGPGPALGLVGAGAMAVVGGLRALGGKKFVDEGSKLPVLKRPALVVDRRSETTIQGSRGLTVYTFTLEFADGSVGDFRFPGRGTSYDLMAAGATGMAYTRGAELLAFKPMRV